MKFVRMTGRKGSLNISNYLNITLAVVSVIVVLIATFYHGKSRILSTVAVLITQAEKTYGSGTGTIKLNYVVGALYAMLPAWIRPFLPQAILQTFVQAIFNSIKSYSDLQIEALAAAIPSNSTASTIAVTETAQEATSPTVKSKNAEATAATVPVPNLSVN